MTETLTPTTDVWVVQVNRWDVSLGGIHSIHGSLQSAQDSFLPERERRKLAPLHWIEQDSSNYFTEDVDNDQTITITRWAVKNG